MEAALRAELGCDEASLSRLRSLEVALDCEEASLSEVGLLCPQLLHLCLRPPLSQLSSVRGLCAHRSFPSLTSLSLVRCGLTDLTGVNGLARLRLLDVSCNPVDDLSPLQQHPTLSSLVAAHTALSDVHQVEWLTSVACLAQLDLRHTRAARSPTYEQQVRKALPSLTHLDGQPLLLSHHTVHPQQRRAAAAATHQRTEGGEEEEQPEEGALGSYASSWPWLSASPLSPPPLLTSASPSPPQAPSTRPRAEVWTLHAVDAAEAGAEAEEGAGETEDDGDAEVVRVLDPASLAPHLRASLLDKGVHAAHAPATTAAAAVPHHLSPHLLPQPPPDSRSVGSSLSFSSASSPSPTAPSGCSPSPCSTASAPPPAASTPLSLRPFTSHSARPSSSSAVMSSQVAFDAGLVMPADTRGSSSLTFLSPRAPADAKGHQQLPISPHQSVLWCGSFLIASRDRRRKQRMEQGQGSVAARPVLSSPALQHAQQSSDDARLASISPIIASRPSPLPPRSPHSRSLCSNSSMSHPSPPLSPSSPFSPSAPISASSASASRLSLSSAPSTCSSLSSSFSSTTSSSQRPSGAASASASAGASATAAAAAARSSSSEGVLQGARAASTRSPPSTPPPPSPGRPGAVVFAIDSTASSLSASPRSTLPTPTRSLRTPSTPSVCSASGSSPHLQPLHAEQRPPSPPRHGEDHRAQAIAEQQPRRTPPSRMR